MVLLQQGDPLKLFVKRREFLPSSGFLSGCDITLNEEKNGYVARDQLLYALLVKCWTHARSIRYAISARSRGNKDQSGLSHRLHY